ncbi:unnamed protein product [Rotaria sp. Silwood1]|nr:unnamed protein product [Rotaria sp. Silwood1]CAF4605605.1 unnamed protein product [Rotaria sp. Silwood1]
MSTPEESASSSTMDIDKPSKISKNQQRKQKRYALLLEKRKSKRKEEKAKQKQRHIEKLKNAEDQSLLTRHGLKSNRMENSSCRIRICIDCRYDSMMNDKDIEEPKPCAEVHERRGEVAEAETPPPLNL